MMRFPCTSVRRASLRPLLLLLALLALGGCAAPNTKYAWGNYESTLYEYYKAPANLAEYRAALKAIIDNASISTPPQKVPPGIYAEYGYLMMLERQNGEAVRYFEREKQAWPEAAAFMDTMIRIAQTGGAAPAAPSTPVADSSVPAPVSTPATTP